MFTDPKAIDFFTTNMILIKINAKEDTAVSNQYHAKAFPTSILICKNGTEVDRLVGFDSTNAYLQTFVDYTNGIGTLDDLLGRAEGEVDRSLFMAIADKYMYRGTPDAATAWLNRVIEVGEPLDSLAGEARMGMAYMLYKAEKYDEAITEYGQIESEFVETYHSMDAGIYQAICHRNKADTTAAIGSFERYVEKYPESTDVEWATLQIEKLKNPLQESGE